MKEFYNEKNNELVGNIINTTQKLNNMLYNYRYADQNQIDYYAYEIQANKYKLDYLLKLAKNSNIKINNIEKIKFNI